MTVHRRAWMMHLLEGAEKAYEEAHAAIWPEMLEQMASDGVRQFVLYRSGRTIFAYQERSTPFPPLDSVPSDLTKRWWDQMAALMVTDEGNRPLRNELREVFALDVKENANGRN